MVHDNSVRILPDDALRCFEFDHGTCVFVQPDRVNWIKTSSTGKWIFEELRRRPRPVEDLVADTAGHYGLPAEVVDEPVRRLVDEFCLNGLAVAGSARPVTGPAVIDLDALTLQEVWFNITAACNLHCAFCYVPGTGPQATHVPLELADRLIDEAAAMGVHQIVLAGGEPTLHPHLLDMARQARRRGIPRLKLITNGTKDSPDYWEPLLPLFNDIQVSVDGTDAETHNRLRGPHSFERLTRFFRLLSQSGPRELQRGLSFTPLPENMDQLPQLLRLALTLDATYIHLNRPKASGRTAAGDGEGAAEPWLSLDFLRASLRRYDELLTNIFKDREFNAGFGGRPEPNLDTSFDPGSELFTRVRKSRCAAGVLTLCVDQAGLCYPCAALCHPGHACGDINRQPLAEIYRQLRRRVEEAFHVDRDPTCSACDLRYFCGGGCRAVNRDFTQRDRACAVLRDRLTGALSRITNVAAVGVVSPDKAGPPEVESSPPPPAAPLCG